ncbi:phage tail protein [Dyella sp. 2RAF44]|uniref:phage tail protein n=1 Tax=Dyella sp. 2RAF44 TaxID=3233000 RepID=UPI003F91E3F7
MAATSPIGMLENARNLSAIADKAQQSHNSGNAPVALMLGGFKFSLNTAIYQQTQRSTSWEWAAIERFSQLDALQYVGPGEDTVTLPGVIYPDFRGDGTQMGRIRDMANAGKPYQLVGSSGAVLGYWVIQKLDDNRSNMKPDATWRKQEFTITLKYYGPTVSK